MAALVASFMIAAPLTFAVGQGIVGRSASARASNHTQTPATKAVAAAVSTTTPQAITGVQPILDSFAAAQPAPFSISVIDLKTGATAGTNADKVFVSASLYKLFVAQSIYKMIDNGKLNYGSSAGGGSGLNVGDCLKYMITVSDNTCGVALGNIVGWERQNSVLHDDGFTHTGLYLNSDEKTSASDVALLLQRLYGGTLLSPNSSAAFLDLLKAQRINNRLPVGLPSGTTIAHKTGDLGGLVHDAGIVYSPHGDYVISGMSGPWSDVGTAPSAFADLSTRVYAQMQSTPQ